MGHRRLGDSVNRDAVGWDYETPRDWDTLDWGHRRRDTLKGVPYTTPWGLGTED